MLYLVNLFLTISVYHVRTETVTIFPGPYDAS